MREREEGERVKIGMERWQLRRCSVSDPSASPASTEPQPPHLPYKEDCESNLSLRPCTTTASRNVKTAWGVDRLSSLPDELLSQILSFLPTMEAVATAALSRRWRHVFKWITRLDFDDTRTSYCVKDRHLVEKMTAFQAFVHNVLEQCLSDDITSFRLKFGGGDYVHPHDCVKPCLPDVNPLQLNMWMCYPLTRGVKELNICALVRNPTGKVPVELFACQTLEVLKLEANLDFEVPADAPLCLPNLKVFLLRVARIPYDDFVARLLSSCPSIRDLGLVGCWDPTKLLEISSPSLRRLVMRCCSPCHVISQRTVVRLTAPNLELLDYADNFACKYSIQDLNALIVARLNIAIPFSKNSGSVLSLLKPLFNVRYLYLSFGCVKALEGCEIKLPVFHNLRHLRLHYYRHIRWRRVLLDLLNCSPFLEILSFPKGISSGITEDSIDREIAESECQYWSTTQTIPSCLESHLKKIEIWEYKRVEPELEMVKYFLRSALVLAELVVIYPTIDAEGIVVLEDALQKLPRGSMTCSIKVQ